MQEQKRGVHAPDEPGTAVREGAVLPPGTKMVAAADTLPACPDDREVVLPDEHVLRLAAEAITQVGIVNVAVVEAHTFSGEADRSCGHVEYDRESRVAEDTYLE